jgi:hypothetical protein
MSNGQASHIELKSPELQEIMSRPPAWLTRWGIVMILILFLTGLTLCWFINYPDVIKSSITLDTNTNEQSGLIAMIKLPVSGPCVVKPGQEVLIQFDQYPYLEYGVVSGLIRNVDFLAGNNCYRIIVALPTGLTTNTGKGLNPIPGMRGNAEIKIRNLSLLQRFTTSVFRF